MYKPNIVVIGHVCIDQNKTEHAAYTGWGSSVLYISEYLRTVRGLTPTVITQYGPDILPYLPPLKMVPPEPNQPETLRYENDTSVAPRIWRCHGTEFAGEPSLSPEGIAAVKAADIVIVATLLPNYSPAYVQELLSHVKPGALKVLCPQGYFRHIAADGLVVPRDFVEAPEILPNFDLIVYSEEDSPRAFELAHEWKQAIAGSVIVTQGANGASIVNRDSVTHIPTTPIPPKDITDSVGCGDVFDATVASEYFQTKDLPAAVRAAHVAAAKKLRSPAPVAR